MFPKKQAILKGNNVHSANARSSVAMVKMTGKLVGTAVKARLSNGNIVWLSAAHVFRTIDGAIAEYQVVPEVHRKRMQEYFHADPDQLHNIKIKWASQGSPFFLLPGSRDPSKFEPNFQRGAFWTGLGRILSK